MNGYKFNPNMKYRYKWMTSNCEETKKILGKYFHCCNTCHTDPYEREMGVFEKYTKFQDLLFEACCGFPKLTDEEWILFEEKLIKNIERKNEKHL